MVTALAGRQALQRGGIGVSTVRPFNLPLDLDTWGTIRASRVYSLGVGVWGGTPHRSFVFQPAAVHSDSEGRWKWKTRRARCTGVLRNRGTCTWGGVYHRGSRSPLLARLERRHSEWLSPSPSWRAVHCPACCRCGACRWPFIKTNTPYRSIQRKESAVPDMYMYMSCLL